MTVDNNGEPGKRRPSFKGRIMLDVSQGKERVRAWPRARGKSQPPETREQMEWFRQAQWATKYWPASVQSEIAAAVKSTPLLPRDMMTMIMANRAWSVMLPDGTEVFPEVARNDVSDSLNVIAQTSGSMLVRGADYWEGLSAGPVGYLLKSTGPDTVPEWSPPVSANARAVANVPPNASSATGQACKGAVLTPPFGVAIDGALTFASEVNGATYKVAIYELSGLAIASVLFESDPVTATATATISRYWPFDAVNLSADVDYMLAHIRTDGGNTAPSGLWGGLTPMVGFPTADGRGGGRLADASPTVGDAFAIDYTRPYCISPFWTPL